MIELTLVVAVIAMLMLMAAPAVNKAAKIARRDSSHAIVKTLQAACFDFFTDMKEFPRSSDGNYGDWTGSELLRLQLVGYGPDADQDGAPGNNGDNSDLQTLDTDDGFDGFGFRTWPHEAIHGPYVGTENLKYHERDGRSFFIDAFGNEIFYYRADSSGSFADEDNEPTDLNGQAFNVTDYATNPATSERLISDVLIFSAGGDGRFVPGSAVGAADSGVRAFHPDKPRAIDDITNFVLPEDK